MATLKSVLTYGFIILVGSPAYSQILHPINVGDTLFVAERGFGSQAIGFLSIDNARGFLAYDSKDAFVATENKDDAFVATNNGGDGYFATNNEGYAAYLTSPSNRDGPAVHIGHNAYIGLDLEIDGVARLGADEEFVIYLNRDSVNTVRSLQVRDKTGNSNALILYENGNATFSGTVTAVNHTNSSDFRYKKNIISLTSSLSNLSLITGVNYDWDQEQWPNRNFSNERQIGFIAQELENVYPELVHTDEEGYKSVAYNKMTAVLVEAVKELNEKLVKENDELKQLIQRMDARLSQLEGISSNE